ncbi:MAG: phage minor capsid protein [Eubacteriales bacterium]|nr:phage minor capsid protein [Eubacteriales bacterium]
MTPEQTKRLTQPIVELYEDLTDELMTAVADQLASYGYLTETAKWKTTKLAQSGAFNRRAARIIAERTKICPELIVAAVENAAWQAINEVEEPLQDAARQGVIHDATIPTADSVMQVLAMYQRQAEDACNLVNTVMLYKVRDAYTGIVNKTADLANRPEYLQILGKRTGAVATGMQSRQAAVRQCIREFSEKGLPGFVDKRGREWSPEAYINMDIRTTVNNVAHETQFARMDAYGSDLIEVSSHAGARPLCAPFQGKLYSRSGKSGYTTDLHGNRIPYASWASTSYGQAAGLLGINCGHFTYPFFPGLSVMAYATYPAEENAKISKQSQKQRYLERRVRASKRECVMLDKIGDKEGFQESAARLRKRKCALNDFLNETGRTARNDRTQVSGFDRTVNRKTVAAAKKYDIIKPHLQNQFAYVYNGERTFIPNNTTIEYRKVIAGNGADKKIRVEPRLIETYGGKPGEWSKCVGKIESSKYIFDVHWYERDGKQYEMKLKFRKER